MRVELAHQRLSFKTEHVVSVMYREQIIHRHRIDLLVAGVAIVEIKSVARLEPSHTSQLVSYLRATKRRARPRKQRPAR